MFELKFAKTYDNNVFTNYNLKPVVEDYFRVEKNIFCVSDGVTRDSIYGKPLKYPQNEEEARHWIEVYPNPSGVYQAAKICADDFIKYMSEKNKEDVNENSILDVVKKVNKNIQKINQGRKIDYLANDLFCCVAVGGYILNNYLYCFSIGDCHIKVLDSQFNTIFATNNNHKQFEDYLYNVYCKNKEYNWKKDEDRVMVRKDYRNKPNVKYQGKDVSFGVLSGEVEAEYYIDTYKVELENAKYICAYSDGCEKFLNEKEHIKKVMENPITIKKQGDERTLIIYENMNK